MTSCTHAIREPAPPGGRAGFCERSGLTTAPTNR